MSRHSFASVSFLSVITAGVFSLVPMQQSLADSAHNQKNGSSGDAGWFVPQAPKQAPPPVAHHRPVAAPADEAESAPADMPADTMQAPPVLPLPPVPAAPTIGKEAPPPPAIIGIISVQGVMMLSTAVQEIQQVLGARRDRLAHEVQKEEAAWRREQQKLQVQARKLTDDQIQMAERNLQERRAKDQRDFTNKARIIQEAYQVAFHQVERELEQRGGIIANIATAHGMNLVLHAEQAVLHVEGQDITEEVAQQLNKVLPHVFIPDEKDDPEILAKSGKMPTTADEERLNNMASAPDITPQNHEAPGQASVVRKK